MDQVNSYHFNNVEEDILADALCMYANYMEYTQGMLVGDESDAGNLNRKAKLTSKMAEVFLEKKEGMSMEGIIERENEFSHSGRVYELPADFSEEDFFEIFR